MAIEEEWKDVVGFESGYQVSNRGNIRSKDRQIKDGRMWKGRALKPWPKDGYRILSLPDGSKTGVHRLVCLAFYGPPPEGKPFALHRNGIRDDNRVENLYWGSYEDNVADALKHGTHAKTNSLKTHCPKGHPYSGDNLYTPVGTDYRQCRECRRVASKKSNEKQKNLRAKARAARLSL